MASIIKVKNPNLPQSEETSLSAKYTSGTSLTVKNSEGWADNDIVVVGNPGQEKTERGLVSGVSGNTIVTLDSALNFDHPIDTPLFRSEYNQISLERKPSAGAYAVISEGLQNIEWDEKDGYTKIKVAAGETTDTYKWRFYNSLTAQYSAYSGELPGTGLTQNYAGYLIEIIRSWGKIPAQLGVDDLWILRSLNRGQRNIDALHDRWWFALVEDSASTRITSIAGTYKYDLPSTFRAMHTLSVLDTNDQRYNLSYVDILEFDSFKVDTSTSSRSDTTKYWTLLPPDSSNTVGYFGVHSTPVSTDNYFYRRYWRFLPELTSFASQTLIPLPETLINWVMYEMYKMKQDRDNAAFYLALYKENVEMLRRLQRRQVGQAEIQRFRGQRGYSKLFGELGLSSNETARENYW